MTETGLYLFCLAEGKQNGSIVGARVAPSNSKAVEASPSRVLRTLGPISWQGIGGKPVRTFSHQGFTVLVQECEPKPFTSEDQKILTEWLLTHQKVVDQGWRHFGNIVPFGFNTIIVPANGKSAEENFNEWLHKESDDLKQKLKRLENRAEYGVQVLWNSKMILDRIIQNDAEVQTLRQKIGGKSTGVAYLLEKKLENLLKERLEKAADAYFKILFKKIGRCVEATRVEKIRKEEPPCQMLLNLSCLQTKDKTEGLGEVLEKIATIDGFEVRFTGPWPPYSFVNG